MNSITQPPNSPVRRQSLQPLRATNSSIRTDAVYVVYTGTDATVAALRVAGGFAKALDVPLILVHYRTVPYPLPVERPTGISVIQTEAFAERLDAEELDVEKRVYVCRDVQRAVDTAFSAPSFIVMGGRRRWWPTRTDRWRRTLEAAGHLVVVVEESSHA